jgi:hypothetical protein
MDESVGEFWQFQRPGVCKKYEVKAAGAAVAERKLTK